MFTYFFARMNEQPVEVYMAIDIIYLPYINTVDLKVNKKNEGGKAKCNY